MDVRELSALKLLLMNEPEIVEWLEPKGDDRTTDEERRRLPDRPPRPKG
jgi:hypothetical protein